MLVLAVILNPRAKKRARLLAAGMNGNVHGCDGDGDGNRGHVMETVMLEVQHDDEKGPTTP